MSKYNRRSDQCPHDLFVSWMFRNVPYIDVAKGVDPEWYSATRTTALVVILLR